MQGDNLPDLVTYSPQMLDKLKNLHTIVDVNSDLQNQGLQAMKSISMTEPRRRGKTSHRN